MSLKIKIHEFISDNPGVRMKQIREAFPGYKRNTVNSAVRRLVEQHVLDHAEDGSCFKYFVPVDLTTESTFAAEKYVTEMPVVSTKDVEAKAEELESKGLFNRAATLWLKAFDLCRINKDRELFLRRRKRCLEQVRRSMSKDGQCFLAGRFSTEGL
jgi:hypothetical protein